MVSEHKLLRHVLREIRQKLIRESIRYGFEIGKDFSHIGTLHLVRIHATWFSSRCQRLKVIRGPGYSAREVLFIQDYATAPRVTLSEGKGAYIVAGNGNPSTRKHVMS